MLFKQEKWLWIPHHVTEYFQNIYLFMYSEVSWYTAVSLDMEAPKSVGFQACPDKSMQRCALPGELASSSPC